MQLRKTSSPEEPLLISWLLSLVKMVSPNREVFQLGDKSLEKLKKMSASYLLTQLKTKLRLQQAQLIKRITSFQTVKQSP
jgi:hypothetical protein